MRKIYINIKDCFEQKGEPMELNKLCLFVGKNGSGKSFILKSSYFGSLLLFTYDKLRDFPNFDFKKLANELLKGVFEVDENFEGVFEFYYDDDSIITLEIKKGEIVDFNLIDFNEKSQKPFPIFMSTNIRLFTNIKTMINLKNSGYDLTKSYKIYDIFYLEKLLSNNTFVYTNEFDSFFEEDERIEKLIFDSVNDFDVYFKNGKVKKASSLSNGVQSIINIVTGSRF